MTKISRFAISSSLAAALAITCLNWTWTRAEFMSYATCVANGGAGCYTCTNPVNPSKPGYGCDFTVPTGWTQGECQSGGPTGCASL